MTTLLIVGYEGPHQVGEHFRRAAESLSLSVKLVDSGAAFRAPRLVRAACWRFAGHRPLRLRGFSRAILAQAEQLRPDIVLATGIAPLNESCLLGLRSLGAVVVNFLTDDPWNPGHRAPWFLETLHSYDIVFTPRHGNIDDLISAGCRRVEYLPFAFAGGIHDISTRAEELEFDLFFAGTGDRDRLPYLDAIVGTGARVCLYGIYWDRHPSLKGLSRGQGSMADLLKGASRSRVGLVLVRRANRDGNSMRTFEVPAMGLCPLVEVTEDHLEIFGPEGECALYFSDPSEAAEKLNQLLADDALRLRLATNARERVACAANSYEARLGKVLSTVASGRDGVG